MLTIARALTSAQDRLRSSDSSRRDAEVLLSWVLNQDRAYLYTWPERDLSAEQEQRFITLTERRALGEPVAYLTGYRDFWNLTLQVNASTLIPRPETELLVQLALQRLPESVCRIIDLGTGTGAIALALASERPRWQITAVDHQPDAVMLAQQNAKRLQLSRVEVKQSNWFEKISGEPFDLVISNPPYIDEADAHLQQGDVRFEPRSALVAGEQGLADIRQICVEARSRLKSGAWLMLEHGFQQGDAARNIFLKNGYETVETALDLNGHERVTLGRMPRG